MIDITRTLFITAAASTFTLAGCEKPSEPSTAVTPTVESTPSTPASGLDELANTSTSKILVEIGATELALAIKGGLQPNTMLLVDIDHAGGPMPATIRLWVGVESGEGALKSKADAHGNHWHGHADCPAEISDSDALWIEVEDSDGKRTAQAVPLD
jgi:hypothetical protein